MKGKRQKLHLQLPLQTPTPTSTFNFHREWSRRTGDVVFICEQLLPRRGGSRRGRDHCYALRLGRRRRQSAAHGKKMVSKKKKKKKILFLFFFFLLEIIVEIIGGDCCDDTKYGQGKVTHATFGQCAEANSRFFHRVAHLGLPRNSIVDHHGCCRKYFLKK